jgi:hypothetical protein
MLQNHTSTAVHLALAKLMIKMLSYGLIGNMMMMMMMMMIKMLSYMCRGSWIQCLFNPHALELYASTHREVLHPRAVGCASLCAHMCSCVCHGCSPDHTTAWNLRLIVAVCCAMLLAGRLQVAAQQVAAAAKQVAWTRAKGATFSGLPLTMDWRKSAEMQLWDLHTTNVVVTWCGQQCAY